MKRRAEPSARWPALAAAVVVHVVLYAVLVVAAYAMPTLRPAWLPTLGASVVNAVVLLCALAVVLVLGWGRRTGVTVWRVHRPWLLLAPAIVALSWAGTDGIESTVVATAVRMLFVGAAEEIIHRGLVLHLLASWGRAGACVLSALIFGLGHVGNAVFFSQPWPATTEMMTVATLSGFGYAALRLHVRAIWPLALLHALNNTAGTVAVGAPPLWFKAVVGIAAIGYGVWLLRQPTPVPPGNQPDGALPARSRRMP